MISPIWSRARTLRARSSKGLPPLEMVNNVGLETRSCMGTEWRCGPAVSPEPYLDRPRGEDSSICQKGTLHVGILFRRLLPRVKIGVK